MHLPLTNYLNLPRLQNVPPGAVIASAVLFVVGMALLGSLKMAGAFYILSLVLGLYLLWRLPRTTISIPPAVKLYLGFYLGFVALVVAHVIVFSASTSNLDQASRIALGLLNGFIFLALFGFSREKLFDFIVIVAAAHASVAIVVTLYQGVDFTNLSLTGQRANGVTNPIPFSEMLFTSLGLVVIAFAARLDRARWRLGLILLALMIGLGIFAVFLTGTRGTLTAFALLFPLIVIALFGKTPLWPAAIFTVIVLVIALVAASLLFAREQVVTMLIDFLEGAPATAFRYGSTGFRLQLWTYGLELIRSAPLFGHGIDSFPQVLQRPELAVPADSFLYHFSNLHNQYLDTMMKMGLIGAVLFFAPLAIALVVGLRMALDPNDRPAGLAILWVGGSYAIYGLTQTFYGHASTTLHYGVFLGMLLWLVPGGRYGDVCQRPDTVS